MTLLESNMSLPVWCCRTKGRPPMEPPPPLHPLPPINQRNHAITRLILRHLQRPVGVRLRLHGLRTQFASGGGSIGAHPVTPPETFALGCLTCSGVLVLLRSLAAPPSFANALLGKSLL